ncbi:MAG: hypothetical protein H7175_13085 [Burkholderiales bacterium]|nr:hypothetical protein [Anaerolineae bacterium]
MQVQIQRELKRQFKQLDLDIDLEKINLNLSDEDLAEQASLAFAALLVIYALKMIGFPFRLMFFTFLGGLLAYIIAHERGKTE